MESSYVHPLEGPGCCEDQSILALLAALEVLWTFECGTMSLCQAERPGGGEARWQDAGSGENSGEGLAAAGKDQCLFPFRVCLCCDPCSDERNSNSY